MSIQPLKSRTIKTTVQKETSKEALPVVDNAMILAQYTAIMNGINFLKEQLDYAISQPQTKPKFADPIQKMEKSLGVWEQTPQEKREQDKKETVKKKSSKGTIIFLVILGMAILAGIYFAWAYTQEYTFFWNA